MDHPACSFQYRCSSSICLFVFHLKVSITIFALWGIKRCKVFRCAYRRCIVSGVCFEKNTHENIFLFFFCLSNILSLSLFQWMCIWLVLFLGAILTMTLRDIKCSHIFHDNSHARFCCFVFLHSIPFLFSFHSFDFNLIHKHIVWAKVDCTFIANQKKPHHKQSHITWEIYKQSQAAVLRIKINTIRRLN